MTNPIAIRYPLDLTGINPNNLVVNEPQSLLNNPNRAFVPNYGPFYTKGLIVIDAATGLPLTKTTQYVCAQLHQALTLETGLEVMQVIVIVDPSVSNNVNITYQVVGGEYAYSVDALIQMLNALQLDNQPVSWGQILGMPSAFPPTQHLHDIGDTYGWEYVVDALDTLRQAVLNGDVAAIDNMIGYINAAVAALNATVAGYNSLLLAHTSNLANPHQTTATQVGLGNVQNYGVATQADVVAGTSTTLYVTPYAVAGVGGTFTTALAAHIADHTNPHQTTATQVGLGNVGNYAMATNAQAITGTSTVLYMNPANTAAAITSQAYTPLNNALNTHIANLSNPHQTTAAQVGLGNVQNFGIATPAQAQAGTDNTVYITAYALGNAGLASASGLAAHIANLSNPHQTTAAQVGLGSVNNTSDINKPVSTATQNALNAKASLGATVNFGGVFIGGTGYPYLYEYETGGFAIRTGTPGAYNYTTFDPVGNLSINGKVTAGGGFQPSDKDLKDAIVQVKARALWRNLSFSSWEWKYDGLFGHYKGEKEKGFIAQDVSEKFPEFVSPTALPLGVEIEGKESFLGVNNLAMAVEMSAAAGRIVDVLMEQVDYQQKKIDAQETRLEALEALVKRLIEGA